MPKGDYTNFMKAKRVRGIVWKRRRSQLRIAGAPHRVAINRLMVVRAVRRSRMHSVGHVLSQVSTRLYDIKERNVAELPTYSGIRPLLTRNV